MHVTMVKKRLAGGETCRKCVQADELLVRRGLRGRIDEVLWVDEAEPTSPGARLATQHGVEAAPFFVIRDDLGATTVIDSVLKLVHALQTPTPVPIAGVTPSDEEFESVSRDLAEYHPSEILKWGLQRWASSLGIAFSGAEDVVLIHMASTLALPFSVFCLDTGRLHPETYRFIDVVRRHYKIEISIMTPDAPVLQTLVKHKGRFRFYDDGLEECCGIRKVEPLRRVLGTLGAWATGQRRDQSPSTRSSLAVVERDRTFSGVSGPLAKLNPLARWTSSQTWQYIRDNAVPFNPLHERGFISIGCEPCTRPTLPGEHERAGRWWWEESTKRECGLHVPAR